MNILITGSKGQLGRELTTVLQGQKLTTLTHDDIDIGTPDIIQRIKELKPEVVIHTAAYTDVDGCENNHEIAWNVNYIGTRNIAIAAEEIKAKLFYLSTDYVFDGKKKEAYIEYDDTNPINYYGKSKLMGENFIRDVSSRYFIIRTSWLYGKKGKNFINTILDLAKTKHELRVVNDQIGTPTYAKDLAYSIKKLLDEDSYGIYHASGDGKCSWYEFAIQILRLSGSEVRVVPIGSSEISRPAPRPPYSVLRNARLEKLGIYMRPWREALKEFLLET